jgi:hypothetical protein
MSNILQPEDPAFQRYERLVDALGTGPVHTAYESAALARIVDAMADSRTGFESWMRATEQEFSTFRSGDYRAAIAASLGPDRELRKSYEQSLARAESLGESSIQSAKHSVAAAALRAVLILEIWLLVALTIGAVTAYWLYRSIARPVDRLAALRIPNPTA